MRPLSAACTIDLVAALDKLHLPPIDARPLLGQALSLIAARSGSVRNVSRIRRLCAT